MTKIRNRKHKNKGVCKGVQVWFESDYLHRNPF